jgi:hypothetical protein
VLKALALERTSCLSAVHSFTQAAIAADAGVRHAIKLLRDESAATMALLGITTLASNAAANVLSTLIASMASQSPSAERCFAQTAALPKWYRHEPSPANPSHARNADAEIAYTPVTGEKLVIETFGPTNTIHPPQVPARCN